MSFTFCFRWRRGSSHAETSQKDESKSDAGVVTLEEINSIAHEDE
jgi:hypothetical protein